MNRTLAALGLAAAALFAAPAAALACSQDDRAYFDGFPDVSCLLAVTDVELDTLGGLRLVTNGQAESVTWTGLADFRDGIDYPHDAGDVAEPPLERTLDIIGAGEEASLELPATTLPLTPPAGPSLLPTGATGAAGAIADNESVEDPIALKVGSGFVMYYSGGSEDGAGPAIFRVTSADGQSWTRPVPNEPVLRGTPGTFDEHGVFGPHVEHDPADEDAPWKMWFSGRGDVYTAIGFATSTDGISWTKRDAPVVMPGLPGSRDAFAAQNPAVIKDGGLYKMWYEGDDSNQRAIHYATSTDGLTWSKGGAAPGLIPTPAGNLTFGAFAPTVWKDGSSFRMILGARKEINGVIATRLYEATSTDGISWTTGPSALTPQGGQLDLNSPYLLIVPGSGQKTYRLYYAAREVTDGVSRWTIALTARPSPGGWPSGDTAPVLGRSAAGTALDARSASGLSVVDPGGDPDLLAGLHWGLRSDGVARLGAVQGTPEEWEKLTPEGLLPTGGAGAFDERGHRDPHLLRAVDAGGDDYFAYFTARSALGTSSIGVASTPETETTLQPDHGSWSDPSAALLSASAVDTGFDEAGVSHPSVVQLNGQFVMYYTGHGDAGPRIGRATAATPTGPFGSRDEIEFTGELCGPDGERDPVVIAMGGNDVRMLYTGLERSVLDPDLTFERTCYAVSTDGGATFARRGATLQPSQVPFAYDETGIRPAGLLAQAGELRVFTTGRDRTGRLRGAEATTPLPLGDVPVPGVPNGWATYQLGDVLTPARDFQTISRVSGGTGQVELWMSVLQPYSSDSDPAQVYWSDFFPVTTTESTEALNFLLSVEGVRWQVRLRDPAGQPKLDALTIGHAPVSFATAGSATTTSIGPPEEFTLTGWTSLTVASRLFQPLGTGTAGAKVSAVNADSGAQVLAPTDLTSSPQTISLSGVDAAAHPRLQVRFDFSGSGQASRLVESLRVAYSATQPGQTPTPTATPTPSPTPEPTPSPTPAPVPPPPAVLSLTPAATKVTYGRTTRLSGRVTVGANGLAGQTVTIVQTPVGTTTPKVLTSLVTDATGNFATTVKPTRKTAYAAALAGVTPPPPVTVSVAHALSLKVSVRGRRATFTGKLGPRHAKRTVTIQRKRGRRWVRFARVRTSKRSTYRVAKRLTRGRHQFRATTGSDRDHLAGRSAVRRARVR